MSDSQIIGAPYSACKAAIRRVRLKDLTRLRRPDDTDESWRTFLHEEVRHDLQGFQDATRQCLEHNAIVFGSKS